ncbi:MAG: hypothetical protein O2867_07960 [Bacteroidetes bacterium]|jgi:hypothetical protein|nr:hypothetical protein [Bacteroidota bacterium]
MKKDITRPEVRDIAVAIVQEKNEEGVEIWNSYLINMKEEQIEGVLVSSKGYGEIDGEKRETSVLRHFLDEVPSRSAKRIEPLIEEVFGIFNEYWVSFYVAKLMYDKKYIFVPESISEEHFTDVPFLGKRGVMII